MGSELMYFLTSKYLQRQFRIYKITILFMGNEDTKITLINLARIIRNIAIVLRKVNIKNDLCYYSCFVSFNNNNNNLRLEKIVVFQYQDLIINVDYLIIYCEGENDVR
eukprot:TRINITY_DN357_c0_g1_i9.p2 TRINITY_DN357_c0_g1~~TRINITY_DN357_c0_g1_i9.p2  ORF type:complete len:108 (-),score=1.01 TRINITY_DN357_c0_g1_i9:130-453(-)